jgi:hypothetical protein
MGTGIHGGFGKTIGAFPVKLSPTFSGDDNSLAAASKWIKPKEGYTDIVIHGTPDHVELKSGSSWIKINHRVLVQMYKRDKSFSDNPIRLIACETGKNIDGFAQNLANKLGCEVMAPSDVVWIHPSGKITIGPNPRVNSGKWMKYKPMKRG